jgi:hypothetical protein
MGYNPVRGSENKEGSLILLGHCHGKICLGDKKRQPKLGVTLDVWHSVSIEVVLATLRSKLHNNTTLAFSIPLSALFTPRQDDHHRLMAFVVQYVQGPRSKTNPWQWIGLGDSSCRTRNEALKYRRVQGLTPRFLVNLSGYDFEQAHPDRQGLMELAITAARHDSQDSYLPNGFQWFGWS